jgi:hypothetical protein
LPNAPQRYHISSLLRNTLEQIITNYAERAAHADGQANKYSKLSATYSFYRLTAFVLFVLAVSLAIYLDSGVVIVVALAALIICFAWLVKKQSGFDKLKDYWLDIKTVNENEIASMRANKNIYAAGAEFVNDKHPYTSDLDIVGENSLYQLINRSAMAPAKVKLAAWLSAPSVKGVIEERQQAVKEIAAKSDWKIEFQAYLVFCLKQNSEQVKNLLQYLKIPIKLENEKFLRFYVQVAPFLLLALAIAAFFYQPARYAAVILGFINLGIVGSKAEQIKKADLIAGKIATTLNHFASAFRMIEGIEWESVLLKKIAAAICKNSERVSDKILQLSKLIDKMNYHFNMVMAFVMNVLFLWDIKQIIALEDWKKQNTADFEQAFEALAEFEVLVSLSSLAINYPQWCFPNIIDSESYTLTAKGLAHPLIDSNKRIKNDFELQNSYHIEIITGSNMAGKSTFLRTIGINTVLALCGAPVCAEEMTVSVMKVLSYMRIKDSLNESTSTFKAEIDRLQMLLKAVDSDDKIYFLIDEMLRGTNSVDKYRGSKAVIERLIQKKGVGMVATHDLQIARLEDEYPDYIRNFYFDIQVKDGEMLFDYKIKPGECTTFNASILLEQIGIGTTSPNPPTP